MNIQAVKKRIRQMLLTRKKPSSSRPPRPNNNKINSFLNRELFPRENQFNRLLKWYSDLKKTRHLNDTAFTVQKLQNSAPKLALANAMLEMGYPRNEAIQAMQLSTQQAKNALKYALPVLTRQGKAPYNPPSPTPRKPSPKPPIRHTLLI